MSNYYTAGAAVTPSSFMAFPKQLFKLNISLDAKVLYSVLLDRVSLSIKNNLVDVAGRVYIIFKQENIMQLLGCANKKAQKLFKELENCDLIERKKRGNNLPDLIFVKKIDDTDCSEPSEPLNSEEVDNSTVDNGHVHLSKATGDSGLFRHVKRTAHGQVKMTSINKTECNNTELSNTQSINTDVDTTTNEVETQPAKDNATPFQNERLMDNESAKDKVKSQIDYDSLALNIPDDNNRFILDSVVKVLADVFTWKTGTISINHCPTGYTSLRERFSTLNMFHIEYVMECIKNREGLQPIKNLKAYIATALFNAPDTIDWYYDQQVKSNYARASNAGASSTKTKKHKFAQENRDLEYLVI